MDPWYCDRRCPSRRLPQWRGLNFGSSVDFKPSRHTCPSLLSYPIDSTRRQQYPIETATSRPLLWHCSNFPSFSRADCHASCGALHQIQATLPYHLLPSRLVPVFIAILLCFSRRASKLLSFSSFPNPAVAIPDISAARICPWLGPPLEAREIGGVIVVLRSRSSITSMPTLRVASPHSPLRRSVWAGPMGAEIRQQ